MTDRRYRFVDEYLLDLNATQAAIRAGYSPKTADVQGARLLANVKVKSSIAARMAERAKRLEITQDSVMRDIEAIKRDAMQQNERGIMSNHSAALKAAELQGKHLGMFIERLEVSDAPTFTGFRVICEEGEAQAVGYQNILGA